MNVHRLHADFRGAQRMQISNPSRRMPRTGNRNIAAIPAKPASGPCAPDKPESVQNIFQMPYENPAVMGNHMKTTHDFLRQTKQMPSPTNTSNSSGPKPNFEAKVWRFMLRG